VTKYNYHVSYLSLTMWYDSSRVFGKLLEHKSITDNIRRLNIFQDFKQFGGFKGQMPAVEHVRMGQHNSGPEFVRALTTMCPALKSATYLAYSSMSGPPLQSLLLDVETQHICCLYFTSDMARQIANLTRTKRLVLDCMGFEPSALSVVQHLLVWLKLSCSTLSKDMVEEIGTCKRLEHVFLALNPVAFCDPAAEIIQHLIDHHSVLPLSTVSFLLSSVCSWHTDPERAHSHRLQLSKLASTRFGPTQGVCRLDIRFASSALESDKDWNRAVPVLSSELSRLIPGAVRDYADRRSDYELEQETLAGVCGNLVFEFKD
jgi:hypothetical protein